MEPILKVITEVRPGDRVPVVKTVTGIAVADGMVTITYEDGSSDRLQETSSIYVEPPPLPEGWQELKKDELLELAASRGVELPKTITKTKMIEVLS